MALKKYQQKRNFKYTPEPRAKKSSYSKTKNLYVVQKHVASHLHYDFRLELNGVLLSWAVPKGPCLDPRVKRLAIHVEDHPVDYGSFEGTIPKGQYGAGTVMLWDRGKWFCEDENVVSAYKKGGLTFTLQAKKLNGKWKLIRINKNDKTWLLIKLDDDYAKPLKKYDVTVAQPDSVTSRQLDLPKAAFPSILHPQLATLVAKPPTGDEWIHEIKFDGYRLLIFKQGKKVSIYTRNNNDWTSKFKALVKQVEQLPVNNVVLDGEIVVLDQYQHANFQLLQNAIKGGKADFIYYIFDLLYYDKYSLLSLPLLERKNILQRLLQKVDPTCIRYSDHVFGSGEKVLEKSCELGLEGIVSKNINSPYTQTRDGNWLKAKCLNRQEFVIGGYLKSDKRNHFRSLMLGTFDQHGELNYHGNVGTGFTQKSLESIGKLLAKHKTSTMPFAHRPSGSQDAVWLKPVLVAEVEFTNWTNDFTLRHPSFKGIRDDKPYYHLSHPNKILYPEDKITKLEIAEYYDSIQNWILPYIANRPLTFLRCPDNYKECFFQKHLNHTQPKGLHGVMIKEKEEKEEYIYLKDKAGLMALPQMGVLEIHPWSCRVEDCEHPDMLIFDLDPAPGVPWKEVVSAANQIKSTLSSIHLQSFVKTTGGKGLHVVVPVKPELAWKEIKKFSQLLVQYLVSNNPAKYSGKMSKSARINKIFIDYLRNQRGATAIAPYSTRARKHAPVAAPIAWDELSNDIRDVTFTIYTLPDRLAQLKNDPWKDFFKVKQSLDL